MRLLGTCRDCIADPDEAASEDSAPEPSTMHKEANYRGMRSLREGGAGFTELQALKLDLTDREPLATELVEANSQSHQVAAWLMRCEL